MKKICISPGDPAGIGPEITLKTLAKYKKNLGNFVIFGDKFFYKKMIQEMELDLEIVEEDSSNYGLKIFHIPLNKKVIKGKPSVENSDYIIKVLSSAALGCLGKKYHGLITGPINKELIYKSGFEFSGHTEFLAEITNTKKVIMMLANEKMKIALLTTHIPLKEVPQQITSENISESLKILENELKNKWKISNPKIAVLGLNPHAGEGGYMGSEEEEIIKPLLKNKKNIVGPLSADTAFLDKNVSQYDAFLAMFHDQGLPVIKTTGFGKSVNITLGLPFLRISVDHGTAYELAGKNLADNSSFDEALRIAISLS